MVYSHTHVVTHPSTNPAVHGQELNLQPVDHRSDALTARLPSHPDTMLLLGDRKSICPVHSTALIISTISLLMDLV